MADAFTAAFMYLHALLLPCDCYNVQGELRYYETWRDEEVLNESKTHKIANFHFFFLYYKTLSWNQNYSKNTHPLTSNEMIKISNAFIVIHS